MALASYIFFIIKYCLSFIVFLFSFSHPHITQGFNKYFHVDYFHLPHAKKSDCKHQWHDSTLRRKLKTEGK